MMPVSLRSFCLAVALVLVSCSNDPAPGESGTLDAPRSVAAEAGNCRLPADGGLIAHEWVADSDAGRRCVRVFTGMRGASSAATREQAQANPPSRIVTITELFDWAERRYPQFFPSARTNLILGVYTYRYYPESRNHVAVAGEEIFVQGPISGGGLLRVGTLAEFTCLVDPALCGEVARDCAVVSSWNVDGNVCVADPGQPASITSGTTLGFFDFTGNPTGVVTYRCTNGTLSVVGTPTCRLAPRDCDTSALSWAVSGQTCTPDAANPKTLTSGSNFQFTDTSGTTGSATYQCTDGTASLVGQPSCNPPAGQACNSLPREWSVNNNLCSADNLPTTLASGASVVLADTTQPVIGNITYACSAGTLLISGAPTCFTNLPRVDDSFGGDGGAADGSANGDGTAGDGAAIVGGTVWVVDTAGKTVFAAAPTDSQGYFRLKLTGLVPPLVVNVRRPDGVIRRSLSTQALKTNGYIFMAVTGLTDWIAGDVARQVAGINSSAALTPAMIAAQPGAVTAAVNALRNNEFVNAELVAAGINPATFDPLATPFRPNGIGHDRVLDNLVIRVDESGATVIGPTYCFTPKSWTEGNNTCVPNPGTPTTIPSLQTLIVSDTVGPLRGTVGFTCIRGVLQAPVLPTCRPS